MENTLEYQNWGWNPATISAAAAMGFTVLSAWGLRQQSRVIWLERKGKAVSVTWLTYFAFMFAAMFVYGLSERSITMMFNGLLALFHIPLIAGLWKFEGARLIDKGMVAVLATVIVTMAYSPHKDTYFLLFNFGSMVSLTFQPFAIWMNRSRGQVNIRLIGIYLAATLFWVIYGYSIDDWVLEIITPIALTLFALTAYLWWRYPIRISQPSA